MEGWKENHAGSTELASVVRSNSVQGSRKNFEVQLLNQWQEAAKALK